MKGNVVNHTVTTTSTLDATTEPQDSSQSQNGVGVGVGVVGVNGIADSSVLDNSNIQFESFFLGQLSELSASIASSFDGISNSLELLRKRATDISDMAAALNGRSISNGGNLLSSGSNSGSGSNNNNNGSSSSSKDNNVALAAFGQVQGDGEGENDVNGSASKVLELPDDNENVDEQMQDVTDEQSQSQQQQSHPIQNNHGKSHQQKRQLHDSDEQNHQARRQQHQKLHQQQQQQATRRQKVQEEQNAARAVLDAASAVRIQRIPQEPEQDQDQQPSSQSQSKSKSKSQPHSRSQSQSQQQSQLQQQLQQQQLQQHALPLNLASGTQIVLSAAPGEAPHEIDLNPRAKTVMDLWKEWEEGHRTQPPLRFLENTYGTKWRKGRIAKSAQRRKKVIEFIDSESKRTGFVLALWKFASKVVQCG
ncbi:unnamed protein product [Ambrosiozyma monospora]|uniref:Unnamed protein product n=1 Tax=Ambrosiozyma monospora TaxID=43982 RepID=A0A9W6YXU7_AMBMO|nr:unnamed protein product [Ambrosiozyma monospora]